MGFFHFKWTNWLAIQQEHAAWGRSSPNKAWVAPALLFNHKETSDHLWRVILVHLCAPIVCTMPRILFTAAERRSFQDPRPHALLCFEGKWLSHKQQGQLPLSCTKTPISVEHATKGYLGTSLPQLLPPCPQHHRGQADSFTPKSGPQHSARN